MNFSSKRIAIIFAFCYLAALLTVPNLWLSDVIALSIIFTIICIVVFASIDYKNRKSQNAG
jgi:hypothetical protein